MNIVLDIGGTKMRVAAADGHTLREVHKIATPQDPEEALQAMESLVRTAANGEPIQAIAGGSRWIFESGVFLPGDPMLPLWNNVPFGERLSGLCDGPIHFVHDTAAVGLGEVIEGAGKGSRICVYVTISTGVGADRIIDGRVDESIKNPEVGKQRVNGTILEDLISGTAVKKKFGIEPKDLDSLEEREKLADMLAAGLCNTTLHWTPDTFVLGGSMIVGTNPIPIERTQETLHALLGAYPTKPIIKMAQLGDNGGLVGAAVLAEQLVSRNQ